MSEDLKNKLNEICAYINAAYSTLMDPQKRKEYDRNPITRLRH
jgi:curved DNA-binding protein CbpA